MLHAAIITAATVTTVVAGYKFRVGVPNNAPKIKFVRRNIKMQNSVQSEICNFDKSRLKSPVPVSEKRKKNDLLYDITHFDTQQLNTVQLVEKKLTLSNKDRMLMSIKKNPELKNSQVKKSSPLRESTLITQIQSPPELTRINPLLLEIQAEIRRRKSSNTPSFLKDIKRRNYKLRSQASCEIILLSDSEDDLS